MVIRAFRQVFADVRYVVLAAAIAVAVFILATWLPNLGLVWQIASSTAIPLADKAKVLAALVGSIGTNFTIFSALSTVMIAVLFGANVAMIAYYLLWHRLLWRQTGQASISANLGGLTTGLFGVGCTACGTLVAGPVLTFLGAGSLVALLPFGGEEFAVLGVGMLGLSLVLTARKIVAPVACPVGRWDAPGRSSSRISRA